MPLIQLPNGDQIEFPDNPSPKDLEMLKAIHSSFNKPKGKTSWGEDWRLAWDNLQENVQTGGDYIEEKLGITSKERLKELRDARRGTIQATRENILKDKEQGLAGAVIPSLAISLGAIGAAPATVLGKGINRTEDLAKDGVDPETAKMAGWIAGGTEAALYAVPGFKAGSRLLQAGTGAAIGAGSAAADPLITEKFLRGRGYDKQAEKYKVQPKDMLVSAGLGAALGGIAKPRLNSKKAPDVSPNALADEAAAIVQDSKKTITPDLDEAKLLNMLKENQKKQVENMKAKTAFTEQPLKTGQQAREIALKNQEPDPVIMETGDLATKAIDEQVPTGGKYGLANAADAAELEALNTPPARVGAEASSITSRFGNETPPGVVNPNLLRRVNEKYGGPSELSTDQLNRYGEIGPTGIVNPKALERMMSDEQPLSLFAEPQPVQTKTTADFIAAVEKANKAADAATKVTTRRLGGVGTRGRKQGGAVSIDALLPKSKEYTSPLKQRDEPVFVRNTPEAVSRALPKRVLDDFLLNKSYENIIADAKARPEADFKPSKVGRNLRPGAAFSAVFNDDPILGKAATIVKEASNSADNVFKKYITGETRLDKAGKVQDFVDNMSKKEFTEVLKLMVKMDELKADIPPAIVNKLTPEQRGFVTSMRTAFDHAYKLINEARAAEGLPPMEKRTGYFPGMFRNTHQALVYKLEMVDGVMKKSPVAMLGSEYADPKYDKLSPSLATLKKEYQKPGYEIKDLPRRDLKDNNAFQYQAGLNKYMEMIAERDPQFAADLKNILDLESTAANRKLFGVDKHEMGKKGIIGSEGRKPWLSDEENAREAFKASMDYLKDISSTSVYRKLKTEFDKNITNNPELTSIRPNSINEAQLYFANYEGKGLNWIGEGGNAVINHVTESLGISPKVVTGALGELKKRESQLLIGTPNLLFVAQQWGQFLTSYEPFLMLAKNRLGINADDLMKTQTKQAYDAMALITEHFTGKKLSGVDDWNRIAFNYAKDNQLINLTEMEHVAHSGVRSKAYRKLDSVMEFGPKVGEVSTRTPVFMSFAGLVKKFAGDQYTDKEILDIAKNLTQISMISYDKAERPMFWNQMGAIGPFAGGFKTYMHGYLGQQAILLKEMLKGYDGKKNAMPAGHSLAAMMLLTGVIGLPAAEEANSLIEWGSEVLGKRISPKQYVLENLPLTASVGALSASTGLMLSGKFSAADVIPNSVGEFLAGPQLSSFSKRMVAVFEMIDSGFMPSKVNDAIVAMVPPGSKGMAQDMFKKDEDGFLMNKDGQRDVYRTDEEWRQAAILGVRPLTEALDKELMYRHGLNEKALQAKRSSIVKKMHLLSKNNIDDPERRVALIEAYIAAKGTPQELSNAIVKMEQESYLTTKQRREGIPQSEGGVRRWKEYNPQ